MMKKYLFHTVSLSTGRDALHHLPCAGQRLLSYHRIFATRGWMSSGGVGKAACVWFIISLTQKSQREPNWLVGCPTQLICIFISIWAGPFQEFLIWAGPFREFSIWCGPIQNFFFQKMSFFGMFSTPMSNFSAFNSYSIRWHGYSAKRIGPKRSFLRENGAQTFYYPLYAVATACCVPWQS